MTSNGKHRNDLQGLRAVAVLLVALGHAGVGFLKGGFVGVDVFFVLSGYLIAGLLLSEAVMKRSVSLGGFYLRRARRILPAAALTLVATEVAAYYLLNFVRAKETMWDAISASVFTVNIHFAQQGTDYFARSQPPSPVEQFWSLSVEEQFYVIFPALLAVGLFGAALRRHRSLRTIGGRAVTRLLIVVTVVTVASFVWSVYYTSREPTSSYFSTLTRAWELGLGAVLAIGASRLPRLPMNLRAALGWLGLASIAIAAVTFSGSTPFPGYAALLPTVGAALVIAAGIGTTEHVRLSAGHLLALPPLRFVGDRSYTFYLWHWPALIIAAGYVGHDLGLGTNLLLLAGAFALSMITYQFYENPIRRSNWSPGATACAVSASVAAVVLVGGFASGALETKALRFAATPQAVAKSPSVDTLSQQTTGSLVASKKRAKLASAAIDNGRTLPAVVAAVRAAERKEKVPAGLTPSIGQLLDDQGYSGCATAGFGQTSSPICRLGVPSAKRMMVVRGDSHAAAWMPTVLTMAAKDGWAVVPLIKVGCLPDSWIGSSHTERTTTAECHAWYAWATQQIKSLHPDVTLVTGNYTTAAGDEAIRGIRSSTSTMKRFSKSVVVIGDPPGEEQQPIDCLLARRATMASCTMGGTLAQDRLFVSTRIREEAERRGIGFLDTRGWFCFEGQCPTVIGHTIAYIDSDHVSRTYALELARPFRAAFRKILQQMPT